ncbi:DUF3298 and DUF4163 domain-containing protein [Metabacillus fastidiosus]|uniref:DUF3298 and DUF4163 domain-containing protein n=1 Tax=Metabacillus fastidiosus TaxID=1458 RepID=UPI002E234569|nr:DUF3298 and DUF4163 domain-containing protein [Metabacillus fastidiosus]
MKKVLLVFFSIILLSVGFIQPQPANAKVMWGSIEMKKGQIGKVTMLKDVDIYVKKGDSYSVSGKAKKNQINRVYTNQNGYLGIGGGKFIKNDKSVKYETPSKSRLQALNGVKVVKQKFPNSSFVYPQVSGLVNKDAENKINNKLYSVAVETNNNKIAFDKAEKEARADWDESELGEFWEWKFEPSFEIHYNQENYLSILYRDYVYMGGAHGLSGIYTLNFDVNTGNIIKLSTVIKNKNKIVRNYAFKDLLNQQKRGQESLLINSVNEIIVNDSARPWVFNSKGIKLFFHEYEVAPYSSGNPEVVVPESVYK